MKNGLSDRDELNICSLGFIKEKQILTHLINQKIQMNQQNQVINQINQKLQQNQEIQETDSTNANITTTTDKTKDN